MPSLLELVCVVGEEHQRGETRRANRVALGHGLGGVAHGIQRIGDVADLFRQVGHFRNPTCVVRDRTVRVERHNHAGHRQHCRRRDRDPIQLTELVGGVDRHAHREHRQGGGSHRDAEAGDDIGRMTGLGGRRDVLYWRVFGAGVVLGDPHDGAGQHQPHQRAIEQGHGVFAHHLLADEVERDGREHPRDDHAFVERLHDFLIGRFDEERADDGRDNRSAPQHQRVQHSVRAQAIDQQVAQHHGRDHGHGVGFEEIGRHACAVTHVVTHVVGDHRRVARVIFRDTGFDFADEVRTDVRPLGEDTAAESRENGDEGAAEGEADQATQDLFVVRTQELRGEHIKARAPQEPEADHQHAGDRTATERDGQCRSHAVVRRLRGAHIGPHGHVHADVTGGAGQDGADQEADGCEPIQHHPQQDK